MDGLTAPAWQKAYSIIIRTPFIPAYDIDGCWVWPGKTNRNGYGIVRVGQQTFMVHRMMYRLPGQELSGELVPDHKCRNRLCCNPAHLEPVTSRENTLRGEGPTAQNARKTHCPQGHKYEGENLLIRPCGRRQCRACRRKAVTDG